METAPSKQTSAELKQAGTIIVFSESVEGRNYLRNRITRLGFNTVCFENEAICFDNFRPLAPKTVIVQTESQQIVWRFLFAVHAMGLQCPMLIVSEALKTDDYLNNGAGLLMDSMAMRASDDLLMEQISAIIARTQNAGTKADHPLFVGQTEAIAKIRSMLPSIAASCDPVLITGEQGTGKELLVRLISAVTEDERTLIKIDCGQLQPEMLLNGRLEQIIETDAGPKPVTLFFDGLHRISRQIQSEILMVIDSIDTWNASERTGRQGAVRIIAASEPVIEERLKTGRFGKDLFYRLNVIPIYMPALRDRREDISLLMDYFIIHAGAVSAKSIMIASQKARDTLYLYQWPGNVEELKTYMGRVAAAGNESCIFDNGSIPKVKTNTREYFLTSAGADNLPKPHEIKSSLSEMHDMSLKKVCEEFVSRTERKLMQKALESTNWNRKKAAELLNISYKSMLNKMKAYDII